MPTLRTPSLTGVSFIATGNSSINQDRHGVIVTYTGSLTINGRRIYSPRELRRAWADAGHRCLSDADRAEHTNRTAHLTAHANATAYAMALTVLDGWLTNFGPAGLPLTDAVTALAISRKAMADKLPPNATSDLTHMAATAQTLLSSLIYTLADTAAYEWTEDN
ncbi:hypothetical protein AB0M79_15015 [Polymorphospora sp. NPDC051019]|uniref:hypothetical protein n=1 Tax=Polymorphospora sp. NPDC051019 TaxID=3155725 RepID=UPI00344200E0